MVTLWVVWIVDWNLFHVDILKLFSIGISNHLEKTHQKWIGLFMMLMFDVLWYEGMIRIKYSRYLWQVNFKNVVHMVLLVGTRDLRTLWSPPVSLNQEGHTQRCKTTIFIFILFIFCDKNSLKSPPWKHMWWSDLLSFLFFIFMCFLFLFCIIIIKCLFFTFIFLFIWMQVWSLKKEDTPHSFSSKVFLHYYKFYFLFFIFYYFFSSFI
jgi:hypothetical protein